MTGEGQTTPAVDWSALVGMTPGAADAVAVRLDSFKMLGDDTAIELPAPGITAVVGANNVGKSTVLRQLHVFLLSEDAGLVNQSPRLIESAIVTRSGSAEDFLAWLIRHAAYADRGPQQGGPLFARVGMQLPVSQIVGMWNFPRPTLANGLASVFVTFADAQNRFSYVGGIGQRGDVLEPPQHPLHLLQDQPGLRARLNELSIEIFRKPLTLDDLSGNMQLRAGTPDVSRPSYDEDQRQYRAAMAQLPQLQVQGDGMKSLIGLLLPLITATFPIIFVDEPEAFLHPPQAYALGTALGRLTNEGSLQVVLATHDRNLLAGLLDSGAPLSVVRLTRDSDKTSAAQLAADQVHALWSDSVLRYSNVLDGLFHQLVVIAEAERDCRFFQAALDSAADAARDTGTPLTTPPSEVLFVPANGKDGMARLSRALRAVGVRVVASPDLDILNSKQALSGLVVALGHEWEPLDSDYDQATQVFRQPREQLPVSTVRQAVLDVLDAAIEASPHTLYTAELRESVLAATRTKESPWRALKEYGDRALKDTGPAGARLLDALDNAGVVTVKVGELEGFAPNLGVGKGKEWLPAALASGAQRSRDAHDHVTRLLASGA